MFSRCRGEMLSEVMLPPKPPQPSVIAGSRPVVSPIDPCVVGVLTQMRNAGFLQAELENHLLVLRVDGHGVAHAAVAQDLFAALAAFPPVLDDIEGQDRAQLLDRQRVVAPDAVERRDQHPRLGRNRDAALSRQ